MVRLSWSTFGLSECVTWGAGDEARERGQTSTHTHSLVVVPFFHLHHVFFPALAKQHNKNSLFLDKEA